MFESKNADRISDFELKLMDIDSEQLGIPDSEYGATVRSLFFLFESALLTTTEETFQKKTKKNLTLYLDLPFPLFFK